MPLDRHAARLLAMWAATSGADGGALPSPQARRDALADLARFAADPPPEDVTARALTTPRGLAARLYAKAEEGEGGAALLYLHGGGWVAGDLDTHDGVCGALARASGVSVVALDYRRAPEHPFPAAVQDAVEAMAWLREGRLGFDPRRVGIAGDSAGANIAAGACVAMRDAGAPAAALQLLICPILDPWRGETGSRAAFRDSYFLEAARLAQDLADYVGEYADDDPRVAPLSAASLADLPPSQLHAAEYDPFRDEALAYADRLEAAGVRARATVHAGMIHYFYALARAIPAARALVEAIGREAGEALARR